MAFDPIFSVVSTGEFPVLGQKMGQNGAATTDFEHEGAEVPFGGAEGDMRCITMSKATSYFALL